MFVLRHFRLPKKATVMGRKHINAAPPRNRPTVRVCGAEHFSGIGFCTKLPGHNGSHRALIAGKLIDWATKTPEERQPV